MRNRRVLISGASIGGPALAYWLHRYGFDVTVVEKAPGLRRGGQEVDFKGPVHLAVLSRMGILDAVQQAHVPVENGRIVSASGRTIGIAPGAFAGGDINIARGKLVEILYGLTAGSCEYLFGDSLTSLSETKGGVDVTFARAAPRTFDLVVGADGIHSNVRALAFGPESDYVRYLGYQYVLAQLDTGDDEAMYNEPGRMAMLGGSKGPAFFVFASPPLSARDDVEAQKRQVMAAFASGRWRLPELMARLPDAREFYMDSISRVTLDRYTQGRVALVGDAGYGNSLGGFGTGLALVGAYVLAGELHRAGGDHEVAFARYERLLREYASVSQDVNGGRILAPRSWPGIVARNLLFSLLSRFGSLMKGVNRPATNILLDTYESASDGVRA